MMNQAGESSGTGVGAAGSGDTKTPGLPSWVKTGPDVTETSRRTSLKAGFWELGESVKGTFARIKERIKNRPERPSNAQYGWVAGPGNGQATQTGEGGLQRKQQFEVSGQAALSARQQQVRQLAESGSRRTAPWALRFRALQSRLRASKTDVAAAQAEAQKIEVEQRSLAGVDGWLMIFVVIFGVVGLLALVMFLLSLSVVAWPFSVLSLINYALAPPLVIVSVATIVLIFRRKKIGKKFAYANLVLVAVYLDLMVVVVSAWDTYVGSKDVWTALISVLLSGVLPALLYAPVVYLCIRYFGRSRRVRETLTEEKVKGEKTELAENTATTPELGFATRYITQKRG